MVKDGKEFTSLQGVIGREYAIHGGEPAEVALAIEEQFYLVFPVLLLALWRLTRGRRAVLGVVLVTLAGAATALPFLFELSPDRIYFGTEGEEITLTVKPPQRFVCGVK